MVLPDDLRARVVSEAQRRGLKLSPMLRVLVSERVEQIEDAKLLSRAEEWQRAQAWATWQDVESGNPRDVEPSAIEATFDAALARARRVSTKVTRKRK